MTSNPILLALLVAAGYTAWPVLGKYSGLQAGWVIIFIQSMTLVGAIPHISAMRGNPPTLWAVGVIVCAGVLNAAAFYTHATKSVDPAVSTGLFVAMIFIIGIALAPFSDWLFNGQPVSIRQAAGVGLAVGAVYLLRT